MEKLTKEWEELKSFLPKGWEEKARESKANVSKLSRHIPHHSGIELKGDAFFVIFQKRA